MSNRTASTSTMTTQQLAGHKAWETRRKNMSASSVPTLTPRQMAAKKAWETIRSRKASGVTSHSKKAESLLADVSSSIDRLSGNVSDRMINLAGTRKLRASAPTLATRLQDATSLEYYYSPNRSVIVIHN